MSFDILICGDFYVGSHAGGRLESLINDEKYDVLFGELYSDLRFAKLAIVNLEAPIVQNAKASPKTGPTLYMKPNVLRALNEANIKLVTLANNHIMDYGSEGFSETTFSLSHNNISYVGAGYTKEEKINPFIITIGSKEIAIVNVCEHEWISGDYNDAGANGVDIIENYQQIRSLREKVDFIIVIYHGGNEYHPFPTPEMKKIFRFFVDAGASSVISHHTHTFSGYEIYDNSPIFYGIGNFVFDSNKKSKGENWHHGIAIGFNILNDKLQFQILPFLQNATKVGLEKLSNQALLDFETKFKLYSKTIKNDNLLYLEYQKFAQKMMPQYEAFLNPYQGKLSTLFKKGLLPSLFTKDKFLLYLNLIRCQSHKGLLEQILNHKVKNN